MTRFEVSWHHVRFPSIFLHPSNIMVSAYSLFSPPFQDSKQQVDHLQIDNITLAGVTIRLRIKESHVVETLTFLSG